MDKNQEIRAILSGKVTFSNGAYSVALSVWKTGLVGLFSGSDMVKILGTVRMARHYQSDSVDAAVYTAKSIFGKLGHPIRFQSEPGLSSCFLHNYLGNPVILTLEESREEICVNAYTARTLFSGMNLRYAFRVFEKHLPDDMRVTISPEEKMKVKNAPKMRESRKERKAKKRAEKLEKRAQRASAKAQAAAQVVGQNEERGNTTNK